MEYIDMTPTWEAILPVWFMILDSIVAGTHTAPEEALLNFRKEMCTMAQAADKWNAHCKEMKK